MEVYLDNAATTKPFSSVKEIINKTLEEDYGNPSSLHKKGLDAERYIIETKEEIAKVLKVKPKEIIFTSGGTESNNLALIGTALANQRAGKHIITTQIEHPSVHNPLLFLENFGFYITYLKVDKNGLIQIEELLEAISKETILVSIVYVNNEIGAVQQIEQIGKAIKEKKPDLLFHVDAIQAFGKYIILPKRQEIDLLSVSGHKIHGPKGIGFLYQKERVKIKPILYGGGQQKDMRSGTENVPGIAGLKEAVKQTYENQKDKQERLYEYKQYFIEQISKIEKVTINGLQKEIKDTAPHIISVSFEKIKSEVLLHALEERGIYVSAGSACASNHPKLSSTLQAIGLKKELLDATLRFSLSVYTTKEELDYTIEVLKEVIPVLRKYQRY